jgi:N-methylhydantoinase B
MADWEFIGKATQFVAEEMGIALKKSAISPNIRERMDHSCAITDSTGMIVAQAEHIPVHLGSFRTGIKNIMGWMENHNIFLKVGDMLITNDPYISGTHMNDVAILAPVYFNGEIVAYVANKAHNVDVGGPIFGSLNPNAKNLYQEGLVIPPVRIVKNDEIDQEIFSFILDNFKDPETATGDINAQIAANRSGIKRISELFSRFGKIQVIEGWKDLIEHSRKLSLQSISNWKMGKFSSVDYLEWGRETIKLQICLNVSEDGIRADFSGTSSEIEYPLNAVLGVTFSATAFAIRSAMKSEVPTNEGFYSIIDVVANPGSLVNPEKPFPVSGGNVETTQRIADLTLHALSQCVDGIPSASSGTMFNVMMGGRRSNGKYWSYYETIGGGNGAGPHRNGVSGVHSNMTNTLNTPVEVAEREYPIFFTSYTLRRNSGGKGKYFGGDGVIRSFIVTRQSHLSIIADRFNIRPYALSGGSEGKPGSVYIKHGRKKMKMQSKFTQDLYEGDEVVLKTPGGSGYGRKDA